MFGRSPWRFLIGLGIALVVLSVLAGVAYQVGINVAATTIPAASGGTTTPVAVPYYGYHPFGFGFGIFGFVFFLLFLFLIFGAIRAFAFGGRGRGWGGPGRFGGDYGPGGRMGPGSGDHAEHWRNSPWADRAHDVFEQWHREAHGEAPASGEAPRTTDTGSTGQA